MTQLIAGKQFGQERALYALQDALVKDCLFAGAEDGESALKECRNITVENCDFLLRYPFWHVENAVIDACRMTETCRAALWYDRNITLKDCTLGGIKALRECRQVQLLRCKAQSTEIGWFCDDFTARDFELQSEYPFLHSTNMTFDNLRMKGKYSFQYVENVVIRNSDLDTKDAFWHAKNVTVEDSVIRGEYLAWYSEGLTLRRCRLIGTQPLCYCKNLVLEDCEMVDCDLSFENSTVTATVKGFLHSVKNPTHGAIEADEIGQIIWDEHQRPEADCRIVSGGQVFQHAAVR